MSGKDRPPAFLMYPRDILTSTVWVTMTPEQRGGYASLLFHAWLQPRPGWLPADDDLLAALSGLAERWPECRTAIARAFHVRKGWWVQPRMVGERRAQQRRHFQAKKGARTTNSKRWGSVAQRLDSESRGVSLAFASAVAVEESKSTDMAAARPSMGVTAKKPDPKAEWLEAFTEDFYPAYPRKVRPDAARRAWLATKPWTQETCDAIASGLDKWKAYWSERETPKDKIPYPATFLNGGQWKGGP